MLRKLFTLTATALLAGGTLLGITATQSLADDAGTVTSSVAPQAPAVACILIDSGATPGDPLSLNFGTDIAFSAPGANSVRTIDHLDAPTYKSCSTGSQKVFSHSLNMTNGSGATWTNTVETGAICPELNTFRMVLNLATVVGIQLGATGVVIETGIPAGALGAEWDYILTMACQGSSGGGTTMTGGVVFTAVLE
jgi:hypothetical protein